MISSISPESTECIYYVSSKCFVYLWHSQKILWFLLHLRKTLCTIVYLLLIWIITISRKCCVHTSRLQNISRLYYCMFILCLQKVLVTSVTIGSMSLHQTVPALLTYLLVKMFCIGLTGISRQTPTAETSKRTGPSPRHRDCPTPSASAGWTPFAWPAASVESRPIYRGCSPGTARSRLTAQPTFRSDTRTYEKRWRDKTKLPSSPPPSP